MKVIKKLNIIAIALLVISLLSFPVSASQKVVLTEEFTIISEDVFTFERNIVSSTIEVPVIVNNYEDGGPLYFQVVHLEIDPKPDRLETDEKGNMLAIYINRHNQSALTVRQTLLARFNRTDLIPGRYETDNKHGKYLLPSPKIESDHPQIIQKAQELTLGLTDPYEKARKIYEFVQLSMTYTKEAQYANKGAISALQNKKGVCEDYASFMVALLRASGVPARLAVGFAVDFHLRRISNRDDFILPDGSLWLTKDNRTHSNHAWVEFYLPGEGWLIAEPTIETNKVAWHAFGKLQEASSWHYFPTGYDDHFNLSFRLSGQGRITHNKTTRVYKGFKMEPIKKKSFFDTPLPADTKNSNYIRVFVDDRILAFDVHPIIENGRTLVPMRAIFESLGATVAFDENTQKIKAKINDLTFILKVSSEESFVNGKLMKLDVPAKIKNGRTLVPLRFVSEAMGASVLWDALANSIRIKPGSLNR